MHPPAYGFTPTIVVHIAAACAAVGLGTWVLLGRKGTRAHRIGGRLWVALMAITAIGSFWIRSRGSLSAVHLLSVGTLFFLVRAIVSARAGNILSHRRAMIATFGTGLLGAGIFTLLPGRLLGWHLWRALGLA